MAALPLQFHLLKAIDSGCQDHGTNIDVISGLNDRKVQQWKFSLKIYEVM